MAIVAKVISAGMSSGTDPAVATRARGSFWPAGTGALVHLALRRDRILIPAWVTGFAVVAGFSAAATMELYPDAASRITFAEVSNATTGLVAMYGRIYDPGSLGAISLLKLSGFGAALVALLMVVIVVRHTRSEEEAGRLELLGAASVARSAPLAAAAIVAVGTNGLLALLTASGLIAAGLPMGGSLLFGLSWAASGMVFAAVAAVTAQLVRSPRAATGLGVTLVGLAYLVRAAGDARNSLWLALLSPVGWSQQVRAYAGNRLWPLGIALAATVVLFAVAFRLRARRDLAAGILPERSGSARATAVGSPLGLAWVLQRGAFAAWLAGFVFVGMVLGSLVNTVSDLLDNPAAVALFEKLGGVSGLADAFLATELAIMGMAAAAFGVAALGHLRSEESAGRAELVLATPTSRERWALGHVLLAATGVVLLLLLTGLATGAVYGKSIGDYGQIWRVGLAALAHVPAGLVFLGVYVALFGWLPRATPAAWAFLIAGLVIGEFGPLFELPGWLMDLSPFSHSPRLPGGQFSLVSVSALLVLAAVLAWAGMAGWRRRDEVPTG